ncbi:MAG: TatD family hydrolase [Candidatus Pacebacteria bacterium]|nr:TatD family hydrolase [Candidatus Paceibacterota bacterium]
MYEYIDTHAHLDMEDYNEDREELIKKLQEENIGVITIGVNKKTSFEAVGFANQYENVYATIGYHPIDAKEEFKEEDFVELVKNKKVVGVGECGLDYFHLEGDHAYRQASFETESQKQKENFKKQIDFAVKYDLPLVIHCRDAHEKVIEILEAKKLEYGKKLRGVIHFFSGGIIEAEQYLKLGFYFSFGGVITFSSDYDEVLKFIPIERILPETDAPFVAPVPYRGQRNEPLYVKEVYKKMAELKNMDLEEIRVVLLENIYKLFIKLS